MPSESRRWNTRESASGLPARTEAMKESLERTRDFPLILLVHPPTTKACEPPAGIARLAGALRSHGVRFRVWDANLGGLVDLLERIPPDGDRRTRRAVKNRTLFLERLRSPAGYQSLDRYKQAVGGLDHLLKTAALPFGVRLGLANFEHTRRLPVRSADLLDAAETPRDNPYYSHFSRKLRQILEEDSPSVAGFSLSYLSQALCTFAMMGFLRREAPGIRIALGGSLLTSWVKGPHWKNPFGGLVDHCIPGPGEDRLLRLAGIDPEPGRIYAPDYSFAGPADYLSPFPVIPYSASSGCYWKRCAFCPEQAEGNPYRPIPSDRVLQDLGLLTRAGQTALVHFLDNAMRPSLLEKLMRRPPGVPWYGFARVTSALTDQSYCRDLKRAGCVLLKLGIESGDQEVLDRENKGIRLEDASGALRTLHEAGIGTYVYLLFGTPAESYPSALRTLDFTVRHGNEIDFLNLSIFNLPVGNADSSLSTAPHYEGDLSLYTGYEHAGGWDRKRVRQFLDREFRRHPGIAQILRREPPVFTSNHAPFFVRDRDLPNPAGR